jgi:hypothetical protein
VHDLPVAGVRGVPAVATAAVLNVTAVAPSATTDLRVYPTGDGVVPGASSLNAVRGETTANAVVVRIGRDGKVRLRNTSGEVGLVVDLAAWFGPTGDGWDISWPQCTSAGSTSSNLPEAGAFAVVGRTRGAPFTENECFAAQWRWASSLPGEPSVYLNVDAPASGTATAPGVGGGLRDRHPDHTCGRQYGERIAQYALDGRLPDHPVGRPADGLAGRRGAVRQRALLADRLCGRRRREPRGAQRRRRDPAGRRLPGRHLQRPRRQQLTGLGGTSWATSGCRTCRTWVFRVASGETAAEMCAKPVSPTGGPVVMVQDQPTEGETQVYDVDHVC